MPTLPVATDFTGSGITEAQFKTAMTNLRGFLADLLGTAGTIPIALASLQVPFAQGLWWVSGAYSVTTADRGRVLGIGAAVTVTLPAAATAGSGFMVAVRAFANGAVVDGYGAELIDGAASITLNAGESAILVCNSSEWWTVGRTIHTQTTPGYRHAAGSALYRASDAECICASNTSYESIPGYGGFNTLTIDTAAFGWFKTTGVHVDRVVQIDHPGIVTASVQLRRATGNETAYVRVCKNGAIVQEFSQTSESWITYTVNISVQPGDIITFQKKSSASTVTTSSTRYHRILVAQPT